MPSARRSRKSWETDRTLEILALALVAAALWIARDVVLHASAGLRRKAELAPTVESEIGGRKVDFSPQGPNDTSGSGLATAQLHATLPEDVRIVIGEELRGNAFYTRMEFEAALSIYGLRQDRVIRSLHQDGMDRALREAVVLGATVCIHQGRVWLNVEATNQPREIVLLRAAELAAAFDIAWRVPWEQAANDLGLEWVSGQLTGTIEGVPIVAVELPTADGWQIYITAAFAVPLPLGFHVARGSGGMQIGDLMLDSALRVTSPDHDQARELLLKPGVREPLLELIHGNPPSEINSACIQFETQTWLSGEELVRHVRMIVALARSLSPTEGHQL